MTEARRKPLLVDRFLAQSYSDDHAVSIVPYPFWETTRSNLLLAKRFVFEKWFCECGGLRWWRKQHMRGHEEKGLVTSEYKVTE